MGINLYPVMHCSMLVLCQKGGRLPCYESVEEHTDLFQENQ